MAKIKYSTLVVVANVLGLKFQIILENELQDQFLASGYVLVCFQLQGHGTIGLIHLA